MTRNVILNRKKKKKKKKKKTPILEMIVPLKMMQDLGDSSHLLKIVE